MQPDVAKRLLDAPQAVRRIKEFTEKLNFDTFAADELTRAAVERQFEIIGEALGRAGDADSALEDRLPDLRRIVGLRNRLVHGYDQVDDEIIWDIVETKLDPLEGGFPTKAN